MKRAHARCAFVVVMLAASCDNDPDSHVYVAQLYEAADDCLDPNASIDLVAGGSGPVTCAPVCLVSAAPNARTYVSTMCAPFPPWLDATGQDATCATALAAFTRGNVCGSSDDAGAAEGGDQ